jgi:outer membrane protein assembly factor BamB
MVMNKVILAPAYVLDIRDTTGLARIPGISAYSFGAGDFTIELWARTLRGGTLVGLTGGAGQQPLLALQVDDTGQLSVVLGGSVALAMGQGTDALDGSWHHFALARQGGRLSLYLDGILQAAGTPSSTPSIAGVEDLLIGAQSTGAVEGDNFVGQFTELRLWSAARSVAQLRDQMFYRLDAQNTTVGYWTFENQSLDDDSPNRNNQGSLSGSTGYTYSPIIFLFMPNALVLSGTTPKVSVPGVDAYRFGTGDFTVEAWVNSRSGGPVLSLMAPAQGGNIPAGFALSVDDAGALSFVTSDGTASARATAPVDPRFLQGGWVHVAAQRKANVLSLLVDGMHVASAAEPRPLSVNPGEGVSLVLGGGGSVVATQELRVASTGDTPPIPPTAIEYTLQLAELRLWSLARPQRELYSGMSSQLHGNEPGLIGYWTFNTGSVVDISPTLNTRATTHGAAFAPPELPVRPAQQVLSLRGTGASYMVVPSNEALDLGTGDFTIEATVKTSGSGTVLARSPVTSQPSGGYSLRVTSSTVELALTRRTTITAVGAAAVADGKWHHLAWVRNKGALSLYVDGLPVPVGPSSADLELSTSKPLTLGAKVDFSGAGAVASDMLPGRIDTVRLWTVARTLPQLQVGMYQEVSPSTSGLVGLWDFDQQAGLDLSMTGANGYLGADASTEPAEDLPVGMPLSTVHLDGTRGHVSCGPRSDLSFGGRAAYTLGTWIKPEGSRATGTLLGRMDAIGAGEYRLRLVNGVVVAERAGAGSVTGVTRLQAQTWYYVAATYDGTTLTVWVNGVPEASAALGAVTAAPAVPVLLGATANGQAVTDCFAGCIQDARIWGSAQTAEQLKDSMVAWITGTEPELRAYWSFKFTTLKDWTARGAPAALVDASFQLSDLGSQSLPMAILLNGKDQYIDCGSGRSLNLRGQLTIEAWIRVNRFDSPWQTIAAKGSVYQLRRYQETRQITFSTAGLSQAELVSTADVDLLDGQWHHVAAVYDGQQKRLFIDGRLNASAAATGEIALGNGVIYVPGRDGNLMVLDKETGKTLWNYTAFQEIANSPVVSKDIVCFSNSTGNVFAVNFQERARRWNSPIPEGTQVPLMIQRDVVYFSGAGTAISAVDLYSGKLLWAMLGDANPYPPVIQGNTAYYNSAASLLSRDVVSQAVNFVYNLPDDTVGSPLVLGDTAFVACADGNLYAVATTPVVAPRGQVSTGSPLLGSPVADDSGTLYISSADGTVRALTYSQASQSFTEVWRFTVPGGIHGAAMVEAPYLAVLDKSQTTLHVLNLRTGKPWATVQQSRDKELLTLSGIGLVTGALYFSTSDGQYNAYDVENKRLLWRVDLQAGVTAAPAVTFAPFAIGATVSDQGLVKNTAFNGLISDVRLWSVARSKEEIAATFERRLVGDEEGLAGYWSCARPGGPAELDLSSHLNPGTYVNGARAALSDLQLADPLPRIIAQARMMQNWTQTEVTAGNKSGQIVFRTEITLLDANGRAISGAGIKVWTDEPCTITVGGVQYPVDNKKGAQFVTDARGMISVITPVNALTTPTLQIWSAFMKPGERVIIHPDQNLGEALASLQGSDLRQPAQSRNPLFKDKSPLTPDLSAEQAEGLGMAIRNAIQNVKTPSNVQSARLYAARLRSANSEPGNSDVLSQTLQLTGDQPYARSVGPGEIPHWQFDVRSCQFKPMTETEVLAFHGQLGPTLLTVDQEGFTDLWRDFVNGVKKAAKIVIETVSGAVKLIVQWVDTGIQTLQHVFQSVQEVGQAIYGFFSQILSEVADKARKIYEYFAWMFKWDDILATKNGIKTMVYGLFERADSLVDYLIAQEQAFFSRLEDQVGGAFEALIGRMGKQSFNDVQARSPVINPLAGEHEPSSVMRLRANQLAAAENQRGVFGVQGNWLLSTTTEHSSEVTGVGFLGFTDTGPLEQLSSVLSSLGEALTSSKAVQAFQRALDYFSGMFSRPESFTQLLIQGLLEAVEGLVLLAIEVIGGAVTLLLKAIKGLFKLLRGMLDAEISIPVVSWLYEQISGGSKLSLLDFGALLLGIPVTLVFKAFTGRAPFQPVRAVAASATGATSQEVSLAEGVNGQQVADTIYGIAYILFGPIEALTDIQKVTSLGFGAGGTIGRWRQPDLRVHIQNFRNSANAYGSAEDAILNELVLPFRRAQPWHNALELKSSNAVMKPNLFAGIIVLLQLAQQVSSQPCGWDFSKPERQYWQDCFGSTDKPLSPAQWTERIIWCLQWIPFFVNAGLSWHTGETGRSHNLIGAIFTSVWGALHLGGFVTLAIMEGVEGKYSHAKTAQNVITTLPEIAKFCRIRKVVIATEGFSLLALSIIDLLCEPTVGGLAIGRTFGNPA